MEIVPGPVIIEPATSRGGPQAQPVQALANLDPMLDETAVRQALANAEANNQDPMSVTMSDLAQVSNQNPAKPPEVQQVPQKFLKSDGAVDVEKIQASTRQLDEAIQKKEEAARTVDDYMREYNDRQKKFSSLPNADRIVSQLPPMPVPSPVPAAPVDVSAQNFEEIVRRDYAADPLGTTTRLLDLMIQKKFQPLEEREKAEATRSNLQALASKDPRIMRQDVFAAVNAKLNNDPDLWKLKNPHKAAWLEVKEEMRLGEPTEAPAQPRMPSPVLGGGTPPSAPSSSSQPTPQAVISSLHTLDLRDKKQEAMGDEAVRAALAGNRF